METLLTPQEVAEALGMSTAKLAQLRYTGNGPTYMQLSPRKIRYRISDINRWVESKQRTITAVA